MKLTKRLREKNKETPFLIFVSFLISFLISRLYVFFLVNGWTGRDIFPFETYMIHHFYYGLALIIIAGWISIVHKDKLSDRISAVLYGGGLGIFFDEIGLLLTHFTDYWAGITYTVVILISLLMLNFIFFAEFWKEISSGLRKYAKKHNLDHGPWNLLGLINVIDEVENKMEKTSKITAGFIGLILVATGLLVISYPALIQYWVGGAFILSGLGHIIQSIKRN